MNKIWFLLINGKKEGPWAYEDLKKDKRINPDTLIWKEGFRDWKKIRDVPELESLFESDSKENEIEGDERGILEEKPADVELVLAMRQEPPYFLWILIALLVFLYMVIKLYFL